MDNKLTIVNALVAIAEARIDARIKTGDASNASPTEQQLSYISEAEKIQNPEEETLKIIKNMKIFGVILYRKTDSIDPAELLAEIKRMGS
jgi:hypothetical protein